MFSLNDSMRYLLYNRPTDMRKSFHTLSGIITDAMGQDPSNGNVYIFINRTNIEWRELVMIVEGIMEARDSRRTRLENLQKLRK